MSQPAKSRRAPTALRPLNQRATPDPRSHVITAAHRRLRAVMLVQSMLEDRYDTYYGHMARNDLRRAGLL